jgi:hypothetical protein
VVHPAGRRYRIRPRHSGRSSCPPGARGPFLTSPLGANFDPRGEFCPLGVKFSVRPSIFLNSRECSPLGVNEGVNIPLRGHISPLGARGEVKSGPQSYCL